MKAKVQPNGYSNLDILCWFVVVALLIASVVANYHFVAAAMSIRLAAGVLLVAVMVGMIALTSQGKNLVEFGRESQIELRKVVWPAKNETIQTTVLVIALVLIASLIIWGVDTVLLWTVGLLTGQRG